MKKLLFFVIMLFSGISTAQVQVQKDKPVICYDLKGLVERLKGQYDEKLLFSYPNGLYQFATNISMYSNKETGTWTLIEHNEDLGCVLGAGKADNL